MTRATLDERQKAPGFRFDITGRGGSAPSPDEISRRVAHLMISIRNRAFDRHLIDAFCAFAEGHCRGGVITVVDSPYLHNIRAQVPEGPERERREAALRQLAAERTTHARRRVARAASSKLRLVSWHDLSAAAPGWIVQEVREAYRRNGVFAAALRRQSARVVATFAEPVPADGAVGFLLEELPVLIHAYYRFEGGVLDCYPDAQLGVLLDLDSGRFADELPQASALARAHPGHMYAHIVRLEEEKSGQAKASRRTFSSVSTSATRPI